MPGVPGIVPGRLQGEAMKLIYCPQCGLPNAITNRTCFVCRNAIEQPADRVKELEERVDMLESVLDGLEMEMGL